ncbi:MAG: M20 family metallopeptidase [Burkholderiaceae bacterium]|jgi:hippurate hydrolase|nr:M20 family metallopeptidase [Burkholderiaceae bacterium]
MQLIDDVVQFQAEIRAIRRDLHAHPELRYEEHRTSDVVAARLAAWGIEVHRGLGGTGLVGVIRNGSSGRSIGLRADMDALPIQEANQFPHASTHTGKMHACGHDGHTAILLGAARHLAQARPFDGTVNLIFQPAEEGGAGAQRMIDDGLFERFPCDAVFGMHNWPNLAVGQFGFAPGPMMASGNAFQIVVNGKGAHAAMPHLGVDPVFVAIQIAQGLQGIVTRSKKPIDAAVLSITILKAGDATNVVPDSALLAGTVRTFDDRVTDHVESRMRSIAQLTAQAHGAEAMVDFDRYYPPTVNHAAETTFAADVAADIVGEHNVVRAVEPTMGSEDFSFMLRTRPGAYLWIGNGEGSHRAAGHGLGPCMLHNPSYDFNDELIPLGATYWVRLVEKFLAR